MRSSTEIPRRRSRHSAGVRDEGAVIILAMIFLVAVGLTVVALSSWIANDVDNSTGLANARELQTAAQSVTEFAIQNIRYNPLLSTTTVAPSACWGSGTTSGLTIDGYTIDVYCSTHWNPTSVSSRVVTFYACRSSATEAQCALSSGTTASQYQVIQAQVTFDDYPPEGSAPVDASCQLWSWCGEGMTVDYWNWA
jgi:hypothetical protein